MHHYFPLENTGQTIKPVQDSLEQKNFVFPWVQLGVAELRSEIGFLIEEERKLDLVVQERREKKNSPEGCRGLSDLQLELDALKKKIEVQEAKLVILEGSWQFSKQ